MSIPILRQMAGALGRDQKLALSLWATELHEPRILASMLADPGELTSPLMDRWAMDFNSWDLCDQCCANLFARHGMAWDKAAQ